MKLLYSTILKINSSLDRDSFIELILDTIENNPYPQNKIPDINWKGERSFKFGNDKLFVQGEEYRNKKIISVRYEKEEINGTLWETDYIMNFESMKMAIQLQRSFAPEAQQNPSFSSPLFISRLIEGGYIEDDGDLPVLDKAIEITDENAYLLADLVNGKSSYQLPVIYVSRTFQNELPVKVEDLAKRLKGIAHVLELKSIDYSDEVKKLCHNDIVYNGAVSVYYPNCPEEPRKFQNKEDTFDLFDKVTNAIFTYSTSGNVDDLFTRYGVSNSLWQDKNDHQLDKRVEAEKAQKVAEENLNREFENLGKKEQELCERIKREQDHYLDACDEELKNLKSHNKRLKDGKKELEHEKITLEKELENIDKVPFLFMGNERDLYDGEVKDLILYTLSNSLKDTKFDTEKEKILKHVIKDNEYQKLTEQRIEELERILTGYNGMTPKTRSDLCNLGFEKIIDGNHYKSYYYEDERYFVTFAKTPSDRKGWKRSFTKIKNIIF